MRGWLAVRLVRSDFDRTSDYVGITSDVDEHARRQCRTVRLIPLRSCLVDRLSGRRGPAESSSRLREDPESGADRAFASGISVSNGPLSIKTRLR